MSKQQSRSLRDITLSARHGQYQGWIVAVIIIIKNIIIIIIIIIIIMSIPCRLRQDVRPD